MDELLPFYERELAFLRGHSQAFAGRYPKIAARLAMSSEGSEDPHVERMIQSFALLTARVSKKLDDDSPEFTEALIDILYPHYLRAFPACTVVQFDVDSAAVQLGKSTIIARGTQLSSRSVKGTTCKFRSAYEVKLAPLRVADVSFHSVIVAPSAVTLPKQATASLSVTFEVTGEGLHGGAASHGKVRVFVDAEPSLASAVIDTLCLRSAAVFAEADRCGKWIPVSRPALQQVGFGEDEALIDLPARSHPAYRLLTEYFAFPEKFNFLEFDLSAVGTAAPACRSLTLHFVLRDLRADTQVAKLLEGVTARNLRLGCTPAINLFKQRADPIRLTHATSAYPVVADARRAFAYEVYSIDSVKMVRQTVSGDAFIDFRPFYSLHHGEQPRHAEHYWFARHNAEVAQASPGYETEISLVDIDFEPTLPQTETLSLELTCSNRDLPHGLAFGLPGGDLFTEGNSAARTVRMLRRPTLTQRVRRGKAVQWRLISHLALNHLSLVSSGLPAFKEMLRLYEPGRSAVSMRQIEAVTGIEQRAATHWLPGKPFATFVRGLEVRITVDEAGFVGSSLQAFAQVLDHFFGMYVNVNSFTQLVILSAQGAEELVRCEPRSGDSILL